MLEISRTDLVEAIASGFADALRILDVVPPTPVIVDAPDARHLFATEHARKIAAEIFERVDVEGM